ncbi:hypothetical protein SteCoe_11844 [Stentor coeruleus]|uniref:RBR-type E3 ubiquitin transferase n=1 Tax=Stentor coeruleus TaxID=5963 RepID=A0A1R2CC90_9CILI|nr:hypothetical protein SteCoe_11844 [Stentor coeruleus]
MDDLIKYERRSSSFSENNRHSSRAHIVNQLSQLGFSLRLIQNAILYTNSNDLTTLIFFLSKGPEGWDHEFIPNEEYLCEICNEKYTEHSSFIRKDEDREILRKSIHSAINTSFISLQEDEKSEKKCGICFEVIFDQCIIPGCDEHFYCKQCITKYLEAKISNSQVSGIPCPGTTCRTIFSDDFIRSFISPDFVIKYDKFCKREKLIKDPFIKFCNQPDCEGYIRGSSTDVHQFCNICSHEMCFLCGKDWHLEVTCEEIEIKKYNKWAEGKDVKVCPFCNYKIEKNEGCNHMTCIICKYEFCWVCLNPKFSNSGPCACPQQYNNDDNHVNYIDYDRRRIIINRILLGIFIFLFWPLLLPLAIIFAPTYIMVDATSDEDNEVIPHFTRCQQVLYAIPITICVPLIYSCLIVGGFLYLIFKMCCWCNN